MYATGWTEWKHLIVVSPAFLTVFLNNVRKFATKYTKSLKKCLIIFGTQLKYFLSETGAILAHLS